jgi:hypothetical protein
VFRQPDSIETGAAAVTNLQLRMGHPPCARDTGFPAMVTFHGDELANETGPRVPVA